MTSFVDPEILSANPKFQALYRDVCINKLNHDGTSKLDTKAQKELESFKQDLHKARVTVAKQNLIKSYLNSLSYRGDELPEELQELVAIIAATLYAQVSREDSNLLRDDVGKFKDNVKPIAKEIWKTALDDLVTLARVSSPEGHPDGDDLPSRILRQKTDISEAGEQLTSLRIEIAQEATALHTLYRKAIETSIRVLEQTIHGSVSRSTKAKADYLATIAEGMNRKLQLQHHQLLAQTKSAEVDDALKMKQEALGQESVMLKRKTREISAELDEYRREKAIEGMAKEYAEIASETEKVLGEIDRLQQKTSR